MSTSTISSTITDATGDPVVGARVVCRLVPAPAFRTADGSEIDPVVETVTDSSGDWSLVLEETASISPSNTNYEVVEYLPSGPRKHTIQVGATDQSLFAALVTPPPAADGNTYLTQASADLRYQALGGGFGSVESVGTSKSAGVSSAAARADHVHDLANGSIDAAVLLADGILTQAKMLSGYRLIGVGTAEPGTIAEGDVWTETDADRIHAYDGSASQRVGWWSASGRTGGTWRRAANQSINSGAITSISWDTEDADSDGFCTPTSSTITVPTGLAGIYAITARVTHAWQNNGSLEFMRIVCSNAGTYSWEGDANNAVALQLAGSIVVPLAAAETITVGYLQGTGGAQNVTARIDVYRLGA